MSEFKFNEPEYFAFRFSGGMIEKYFEGPLPQAGDSVELYCYYADPAEIKLKWRVVSKVKECADN